MNQEIKPLTGIRGIAALWVVIYHYNGIVNYGKDNYTGKLLSNGYCAVDIFFLLSAFVMCLAYSGEFKKQISIQSYITFIKKRFARIYPAYFFWTFMFLAFEFFRFSSFNYKKVVINLLLVQNLFNHSAIAPVFWSLSSEWILYILFPFLYYFLQKTENSYIKIFLILISIIGIYSLPSLDNFVIDNSIGLLAIHPTGSIESIIGINSIARCFFSYVIGINLFLLIIGNNSISFPWMRLSKYSAIMGILIISCFGRSPETYSLILVCSIILISALYLDKEKEDSFFASKFVYFLGQISYSVYLCHIFIMLFASFLVEKYFPLQFENALGGYLIVFGSLVVLIPISYLSYKFIEIKGGSLLKSKQARERKIQQFVS